MLPFKVVTIHFNKFYQNPEKTCKVESYEAYRTFTFQADIYSQSSENIYEVIKINEFIIFFNY